MALASGLLVYVLGNQSRIKAGRHRSQSHGTLWLSRTVMFHQILSTVVLCSQSRIIKFDLPNSE